MSIENVSLTFIHFRALKALIEYFQFLFNKKVKDFQGPKITFKYFQGLDIGLLKSKGFQGFSRVFKTRTNPESGHKILLTFSCYYIIVTKMFTTTDYLISKQRKRNRNKFKLYIAV